MKGFKFGLEEVLSYRKTIEDQKSVELMNANGALAREKKILNDIINQKKELNSQKNSSKVTTIQNLRSMHTFIDITNKKLDVQSEKVQVAKTVVSDKKVELLNASKDKKVLEKLKAKKYKEFVIVQKKNEEKIIDGINSFNSCKV